MKNRHYKIKAKSFISQKKHDNFFQFLKHPTWKWSDIEILMKILSYYWNTCILLCVFSWNCYFSYYSKFTIKSIVFPLKSQLWERFLALLMLDFCINMICDLFVSPCGISWERRWLKKWTVSHLFLRWHPYCFFN